MIESTDNALAALIELGTVEEMTSLANQEVALEERPAVNSHVHLPPNFSAFDTAAQAVELAAEQGVGVLGSSNYYDFDVYAPFAKRARELNVFPLFGLEIIVNIEEFTAKNMLINDPGVPGKMYICGKGITRFAEMNEQAVEGMNTIRSNDCARIERLVALMNKVFAAKGVPVELSVEQIAEKVAARHGVPRATVYLQERHVSQAFQEALFEGASSSDEAAARLKALIGDACPSDTTDPVSVQNALRAGLMKAGKPAFVDSSIITYEQGRTLILALGGIPCYPTLADGTKPICPYETPIADLVENIRALDVHCVELIPIRNEPEVLSEYVHTLRSAGLVVTGGTEHNTLDRIPMEPQCVRQIEVPDDIKDIFWEGACVVAAHQFLNIHNQCGYVEEQGKLNPAYGSQEERISFFKGLGEALIAKYRA